jgi:hypothetical protein
VGGQLRLPAELDVPGHGSGPKLGLVDTRTFVFKEPHNGEDATTLPTGRRQIVELVRAGRSRRDWRRNLDRRRSRLGTGSAERSAMLAGVAILTEALLACQKAEVFVEREKFQN